MKNIIIQFNSFQFSIITICVLLLQFFLSIWIKNRLEKSIQYEYDKKLEEYKFLQTQRQKADVVARFFAKWIKFRGQEQELLERKDLLDYYEDLNRMSFEVSLWVSDNKILEDVMKRFQNNENAKDVRNIIGQFRQLILNTKNDSFNVQNITIWPTDEID